MFESDRSLKSRLQTIFGRSESSRTDRRRRRQRADLQLESLERRELLTAEVALVKDIQPLTGSSTPQSIVNVNGTLYFSATDTAGGTELWKSDGSEAGTVRVKDIFPGVSHSQPRFLTNVNGTLFFTARSASGTDFELWKSDGTAAGTVLVKDIRAGSAGSDPRYLTNVNGTLYFRANDGVNGVELWKSDGTSAGTVLVKDINSGTYSANPSYLTNVGGTLYFRAADAGGPELWKSDGTSAGTVRVKDIVAGAVGSQPRELVNAGGTLFFVAGNALWSSDGTDAGTTQLLDFTEPTPTALLTAVGSTVYFQATTVAQGTELWKSDGTVSGTMIVSDIAAGTASSTPTQLTNVSGTLYFSANDGVHGAELWKSDGTGAGTVLVKDVQAGAPSSQISNLLNHSGVLYFSANDGTSGSELWSSDGTSGGTVLVEDIAAGATGSAPAFLASSGTTLLFSADTSATGRELWSVYDSLAPVINGPASLTANQRPAITWTPRAGAVSYEIWIGNQSTGVNPYLKSTSTTASFTPSADLGVGRFNVWVRSVFSDGTKSAWSTQYSFRVNTAVVISAMAAQQASPRPTISWTAVPGTVRYDLWMDNRTTGQSQFIRRSDITTTTWSSPSDLPIGQYRVWVRAIDAAGLPGTWSAPVNFSVVTPPTPESPLDSTFNRRPTFSWSLVSGAVSYDFVLRDRSTGTDVITRTGLVGRIFAPTADIPEGPYRWWVVAKSAQGFVSQSSEPVNFYIGGRPDLLSPSGSTTDTTPTFIWKPVTVAVSYILQVDRTDSYVSKAIFQTGIQGTSFTPSTALPAGTYRAWIRAVSNTDTQSPWSLPVNFTITQANSNAPASSEPADEELLAQVLPAEFPAPETELPVMVVAEPNSDTDEAVGDAANLDQLYASLGQPDRLPLLPIMAELAQTAYTLPLN